jgi:hypothetical protein
MYASDKQNRYVLKIHVDIPGQIDAKCAKPVRVLHGGGAPMMDEEYPPEEEGDLPSPGERILGYYEDAFYECTVLNVTPGGVHVQWDDGTDSEVPMDSVLPSESAMPTPADVAIGQRVMAKYGDGFYEATVGAVQPGQLAINWDDGSQTWVPFTDVRLL